MAMISYQELAQKKEELAARLGPRLHADGFAEFSQYIERACALRDSDEADSQRLLRKAEAMLPQVERSVEDILSTREQIKAKMLKIAGEVMDEYDEALRELAK
jgi:hypothetical protein